ILIQNKASNTQVGWFQSDTSTCTGGCNLISGNGEAGVSIIGGSSLNVVSGNFIGANANLSANLPNGTYGVVVSDSSQNAIGKFTDSPSDYQGNHIYGNKSGGILVYRSSGGSDPAHKNVMMQNAFSGNGGIPIDLVPNVGVGVDPGGNGPNDGVTAPVLLKTDKDHWIGRVGAADGSTVELYADNGKTYLASATVTSFEFAFDLSGKKNVTPPLVATVTDLDRNTSEFSAQARLYFISNNALPGQKIFAFATVTDTISGTLQTPAPDVIVHLESSIVSLQNDGKNGDMFAKDAYTSGYLTAPTTPGEYKAYLFVNGARVAMTTLTVSKEPSLAVLTDLTALRDEFINVGTKKTAQDIYRGLFRMRTYASDHDGVVIDVRQEIPGYSALNYYRAANRVTMGQKIDTWIATKLSTYTSMHYLVIVGDDAVIPYYRVKDEICRKVYLIDKKGRKKKAGVSCDQNYAWHQIKNHPGLFSNLTMRDIANGYRLSDTQYSTKDDSETPRIPQIAYALGRVFAKTPTALYNLFDAYEKPVSLNPATDSASLIYLHDKIDCSFVYNRVKPLKCVAFLADASLVPTVTKYFRGLIEVSNPAQRPMDYDTTYAFGQHVFWTRGSITQSLSDAELVMIVTHASQFHMYTLKGHNLHASDIRNFSPGPNPPLFISAGCHTGLSISRKGPYASYADSLPAATLEQHIPYIAPMNYSWPIHTMGMQEELARLIARKNISTVGDLFRDMQRAYSAKSASASAPVLSLAGYQDLTTRYNFVLYGLPTQAIKYSGAHAPVGAAPDVQPLTPSILSP
ncbi:MAG: right-handed parallel beta-helix repeat-containing protein, partial [Anaerolineae bacterium]